MSPDPLAAWLDGTADDADCTALLARLREDPAVARRLVDAARDEVLLGLALGRRPDLAGRVLAGLRSGDSRVRLRRAVMRSVRARPRPRRLAWLPPLLVAAALAIAVAAWWLRPEPEPATLSAPAAPAVPAIAAVAAGAPLGRIASAAPGISLRRAGDAIPAAAGAELHDGDQLAGAAVLELAGVRLELAAGTELTLADADRLVLATGRLAAEVQPRLPGHALAIATPQATATVIGTAFALAVADGATRLDVAHGRVRLAGAGDAAVEVADGDWAEARADAAPALHAWRPLFAAFPAWRQQHGRWTQADGAIRGESGGATARILSPGDHRDLELECRLRISGADFAEVQVGDYNWFFEIPARDGWVAVRLRQRDSELACSADGAELPAHPGDGAAPRAGPLAFYVRGGLLEIADARTRE